LFYSPGDFEDHSPGDFESPGEYQRDSGDDLKSSPEFSHNFTFLNRKEFAITDTELKLMAAAAIIGDNKIPKTGNNKPAAIGIPKTL